ncbi:MAG: hypothetical protein CL840_09520 [Crocinitomicaceae bacterium]|nr:hypothetical protein [Crocinitomicaceae bacterium]|tara:strand:+ start:19233 stop:21059 length:1827 start_codon:yes stop_codon:yes gene_type:complete
MKWLLGIGLYLMVLGLPVTTYSQATTDSQLAAHYYQNKEYDKAAMYYKRLYYNDHSTFHYNYFLKCLLILEDYDVAEKLVKGHSRINPQDYKVRVDLGVVYTKQGNEKQAKKEYRKLIDKAIPAYQPINELAMAFVNIEEYELALLTYKKGATSMQGNYPFNIELAEVYAQMGDYDNMVAQLLGMLEINPGYLGAVQSSLTKYASYEKDTPQNRALKSELIRKINQHPNQTLYSELLLWLYQQEGNWKGAYIQTKSLDKRKRVQGQLVFALGETLLNNEQYDLAIEASQYVIDLGRDKPFYIDARVLILESRNQKITRQGNYSTEDVLLLLNDYNQTLDELGKNVSTVSLLKEKGSIQAFYQHELDSALNTFEEALEIPGVNEQDRAYIKLEYGDALLAAGYIWDASLAYGQVDKAFKYDRLGEIAKYKGARINFYTGNFSLAKAQLDVLKGSTSKLIANDAMQLSILITDNSTVDTTTKPIKLYADADLLILQNKVDEAVIKLDSIDNQYPGHALADDILYLRYEIAFKKQDYKGAAQFLESIVAAYSYDILADKAIFKLAELNEHQFADHEKAKELYQVILLDYKDSLYATEARKRYRKLRGDQIN